VLVDPDKSLREAMSLKDAHVMRPDFMELHPRIDRRQQEFLEIRYYDCDGNHLKEFHYLNGKASLRAFNYGFLRMHLRRPEAMPEIGGVEDVVQYQHLLRLPMFIIARKKKQFWEIREKVFL
jgi:DNA repair protein RadD